MGGQNGGGGELDRAGQAEIEGRTDLSEGAGEADAPAAGPHESAALTNPDATPGAGSLPSPSPDDEAAAGTG